jgi:hypothetical protein
MLEFYQKIAETPNSDPHNTLILNIKLPYFGMDFSSLAVFCLPRALPFWLRVGT